MWGQAVEEEGGGGERGEGEKSEERGAGADEQREAGQGGEKREGEEEAAEAGVAGSVLGSEAGDDVLLLWVFFFNKKCLII